MSSINCKRELLEQLEGRTVAFGRVFKGNNWDEDRKPKIDYRFHSHEEFLNGIDVLNFWYNNGYGSQEVFGTVVFTDGSWLTRGEYDGSEWWNNHHLPTKDEIIPK